MFDKILIRLFCQLFLVAPPSFRFLTSYVNDSLFMILFSNFYPNFIDIRKVIIERLECQSTKIFPKVRFKINRTQFSLKELIKYSAPKHDTRQTQEARRGKSFIQFLRESEGILIVSYFVRCGKIALQIRFFMDFKELILFLFFFSFIIV